MEISSEMSMDVAMHHMKTKCSWSGANEEEAAAALWTHSRHCYGIFLAKNEARHQTPPFFFTPLYAVRQAQDRIMMMASDPLAAAAKVKVATDPHDAINRTEDGKAPPKGK